MLLGEILVRRGCATAAQIEAALAKQKTLRPPRRLGDILLEDGVVDEASLLAALSEQFGCEFRNGVDEDLLDPGLVGGLPVDWARNNCILPIRWGGGVAALTCDPSAVAPLEDLALLLRRELVPVLAPRAAIQKAIERCFYRKADSAKELIKDMKGAGAPRAPAAAGTDDLLRVADQAPVTQLVNVILLEALKARASDVHVETFQTRLRIRYRIDGVLYQQESPPKDLEAALVSRLKVMAHLDIAEKRLPQDGSARVRVGEREIDIRVSTVPVAEGERVVLRLLNRDSSLLPLADLGMSERILARFRALLREPNGIILVTGPTGSGKTTTLYAALRELDTEHMNVLTIEDPIEYELPDVGQIQVKPKIGLTFSDGLRHILRQDPDVILVGETRDLETAEIVVRASLTGHLVFSTLHTNDATGAVLRMTDMGIEPYLLSSALRASQAQRLVRVLCPKCRVQSALSKEEMTALGRHADRLKGKVVWKTGGCPACLNGYRGRTGIYEIMLVDAELQEAMRARPSAQELRRLACAHGMETLLDDALDKVAAGTTTCSEVLRALGQDVAGLVR